MKFFSQFIVDVGERPTTALQAGDVIEYIPEHHAIQIKRGQAGITAYFKGRFQTMQRVKICDPHTFLVIAELIATAAELGIECESPNSFRCTLVALS